MLAWFLLPLWTSSCPVSHGQDVGSATDSLLVHAERLLVQPGEELRDVSVLIQDGLIVAVGPELSAPAGTREIRGALVCAGFLNPWSSLTLDGQSVADLGTTPATRTIDAIDRDFRADLQRQALLGGVTCARVQAGVQALIGGVGAVLRLGEVGGIDAGVGEVVLEDACMAASIGITRRGRKADIFDRLAEIDRLAGRLEAAAKYRAGWLEYGYELEAWRKETAENVIELEKDFKKAKKSRAKKLEQAEEKGKEFKEKKYKEDKQPKKPKYNPDAEAMARAYHGEIPLVVEIHRAEEIRNLLEKTAKMNRLRLVLAGATEAGHHADELAERGIPVIVWPTPIDVAPSNEYQAHSLALAGELEDAGVQVLIGTGGRSESRELRLLAALAVGYGLDRDEALAAITTHPAHVFDLRQRLGSVQRGRDADLLVLDGAPLATTTRVQFVISKGRVVVEPQN